MAPQRWKDGGIDLPKVEEGMSPQRVARNVGRGGYRAPQKVGWLGFNGLNH